MGMLGAMAGAGQGLIDYSTTLKEKEKMDWLAQQEAVKHERAMNMQKLQEAGMDKRNKAGLDSASVLQGQRIESEEKLSGDRIQADADRSAKEIESAEKRTFAQLASERENIGLRAGAQVSAANMIAAAEEARNLKNTESRIGAMEKTKEFKEMSPALQSQAKLAMRDPEMYKLLVDTGGEKKVPWEQIQDVWSKAREGFDGLETAEKDQVAVDAAEYMGKKVATPKEAAAYYANATVNDFMTTLSFDPSKEPPKPKATREDILAQVEGGQLTSAEIAKHPNADARLLADAKKIEKSRALRDQRNKAASATPRAAGTTQAEADIAGTFSAGGAPKGTGILQGIGAGIQRRRDQYNQ